jgi:hypothetical protein
MILSETIYVNGEAVGMIRQDTNSQAIAFSSTRGHSPLPEQEWGSIDTLKAAVITAYSNLEAPPNAVPAQKYQPPPK